MASMMKAGFSGPIEHKLNAVQRRSEDLYCAVVPARLRFTCLRLVVPIFREGVIDSNKPFFANYVDNNVMEGVLPSETFHETRRKPVYYFHRIRPGEHVGSYLWNRGSATYQRSLENSVD